ncbi:hypothetical protein EJB05_45831, partial [Eragrostis curvula]
MALNGSRMMAFACVLLAMFAGQLLLVATPAAAARDDAQPRLAMVTTAAPDDDVTNAEFLRYAPGVKTAANLCAATFADAERSPKNALRLSTTARATRRGFEVCARPDACRRDVTANGARSVAVAANKRSCSRAAAGGLGALSSLPN